MIPFNNIDDCQLKKVAVPIIEERAERIKSSFSTLFSYQYERPKNRSLLIGHDFNCSK